MSSSVWSRWPLPLCLSRHSSHYLIFQQTRRHSDWNYSLRRSVFVFMLRDLSDISECVGMCMWCCDMEPREEITYCRVFVCLRVTGPCHSITGHTNLIIQLWAQWAGIYETDRSPGEHRAQSVTTLPFAQWQAVSGLTLIACGCFPDWLLWEWAAFASI